MMYASALYFGAVDAMDEATRSFFRWIGFLVATPVVLYSGRVVYTTDVDNNFTILSTSGRSRDICAELAPESTETPFSWTAYSVFLLLGVAMLWAW